MKQALSPPLSQLQVRQGEQTQGPALPVWTAACLGPERQLGTLSMGDGSQLWPGETLWLSQDGPGSQRSGDTHQNFCV